MFTRAIVCVGIVSVAALGSAQRLIFNFEKMADNFTPVFSSQTGYVVGHTIKPWLGGNFTWQIWSKAHGAIDLESPGSLKVIPKITNMGEIYASGPDGLVKWNLEGKKSLVLPNQSLTSSLELFDVNHQGDYLYSKIDSGTGAKQIFKFNASTSSASFINTPENFIPHRLGLGNTISGEIVTTRYGSGFPIKHVETVTLNPYKQYGSVTRIGLDSSQINVHQLKDGSEVVDTNLGSYRLVTLTAPNGERWGESGFSGGVANNVYYYTSVQSGGYAFGMSRRTMYSIKGVVTELEPATYEPNSPTITNFLADNYSDSGYIFGRKDFQGGFEAMIGTWRVDGVPEPLTIAALGLGVAVLARRRRN